MYRVSGIIIGALLTVGLVVILLIIKIQCQKCLNNERRSDHKTCITREVVTPDDKIETIKSASETTSYDELCANPDVVPIKDSKLVYGFK